MSYRDDLWEIAAERHGVLTLPEAEDAGVPAVSVRQLAKRGALIRQGQGVYTHAGIPADPYTQYAIAVALVGEGAFLHDEAVLHMLGLGNLNPQKIPVATTRRIRRELPAWIKLARATPEESSGVTTTEGVPTTTVARALASTRNRIEREHWREMLGQARARQLITEDERGELLKEGR